ncbi:hypothetical protein SHIRM173S_08104 [Streptomyces hirsutus]
MDAWTSGWVPIHQPRRAATAVDRSAAGTHQWRARYTAAGKLCERKCVTSRQDARRAPVTAPRARATSWLSLPVSWGSGAADWISERWVAVRW